MLRASQLTKTFGGLTVLHSVSVDFLPGEVHALMGENGAGKSTLMKLLAGLYQPDAGRIELRGQTVQLASPHDALVRGIAMIHQELMPIPDLSVAENILLGSEITSRLGWIDRPAMNRRASELLQSLECAISPQASMRTLSVAQTQVVEIAKALARNADVLLMDEPTAALSDHETEALFRAIRRLRERGVAVVYTTHKMDEVFRLADRITVLRDGRWIATQPARELDNPRLISLMVGRDLSSVFPPVGAATPEVILEVNQLSRPPAYRDISFQLRRGEVLGLAGLMGAGRTELVSALFGLQPADSGEIRLHGRTLNPRSPAEALAAGIGMVTEDRKRLGIVPQMSVQHNLTLSALARMCRGGWIQHARERQLTARESAHFAVKASGPAQPIAELSGGNQQKVLLARALLTEPEIVILDEPTRGIDIGAKSEIYSLIGQLSAAGKAVILVSSELPEILSLTHRILVLRQGSLAAELDPRTATQEEILRHAMPV